MFNQYVKFNQNPFSLQDYAYNFYNLKKYGYSIKATLYLNATGLALKCN